MDSRKLFENCCFTVSGKPDLGNLKEITSLGFMIKKVDPLIIEKGPTSSVDIEKLIQIVAKSLEPKLGEDFEIVESENGSGENGEENLSFFMCNEPSLSTYDCHEDKPTRQIHQALLPYDSSSALAVDRGSVEKIPLRVRNPLQDSDTSLVGKAGEEEQPMDTEDGTNEFLYNTPKTFPSRIPNSFLKKDKLATAKMKSSDMVHTYEVGEHEDQSNDTLFLGSGIIGLDTFAASDKRFIQGYIEDKDNCSEARQQNEAIQGTCRSDAKEVIGEFVGSDFRTYDRSRCLLRSEGTGNLSSSYGRARSHTRPDTETDKMEEPVDKLSKSGYVQTNNYKNYATDVAESDEETASNAIQCLQIENTKGQGRGYQGTTSRTLNYLHPEYVKELDGEDGETVKRTKHFSKLEAFGVRKWGEKDREINGKTEDSKECDKNRYTTNTKNTARHVAEIENRKDYIEKDKKSCRYHTKPGDLGEQAMPNRGKTRNDPEKVAKISTEDRETTKHYKYKDISSEMREDQETAKKTIHHQPAEDAREMREDQETTKETTLHRYVEDAKEMRLEGPETTQGTTHHRYAEYLKEVRYGDKDVSQGITPHHYAEDTKEMRLEDPKNTKGTTHHRYAADTREMRLKDQEATERTIHCRYADNERELGRGDQEIGKVTTPSGCVGNTREKSGKVFNHLGLVEKNDEREPRCNGKEVQPSESRNAIIHIGCKPHEIETLLAHIILLPEKMNCNGVDVSIDNIEKGKIYLKGKADEILQVETMINDLLRRHAMPSSEHKMASNRSEKTWIHQEAASSTGNFSRHIGEPKKSTSDVYKTTYRTSHVPHHIPGSYYKGNMREKENCGSSVDKPATSPLLQHGEFSTPTSGIFVRVVGADITAMRVDAIVNAANSRLKHSGGVARAISEKAGWKLQQECTAFTGGERKIAVTDIYVSLGYNLPAKAVLHAVGPNWVDYGATKSEECARALRWTVLRCLVEANGRGFKSIAIPSISAAIFKVPISICTKAYLDAVQAFDIYSSKYLNQDLMLKEILFVDISENMVNDIRCCFTSLWLVKPPWHQLNDDLCFASKHRESIILKDQTCSQSNRSSQVSPHSPNKRGGNSSAWSKPIAVPLELHTSARKQHSVGIPTTFASSTESTTSVSTRPAASAPPLDSLSLLQGNLYFLEPVTISVSTESAFRQKPDLVVVIGELFNQLHWAPGVDVEKALSRTDSYRLGSNDFKFLGNNERFPLIVQIALKGYDQTSINEAFNKLFENNTLILSAQRDLKMVVFTSSILYPSSFKTTSYAGLVDLKLVGDFTRNMYKFLESFRQEAVISSGCYVTIAVGSDAITTVCKVLDSRQDNAVKLQPKDGAFGGKERTAEKCGVCFESDKAPYSLTCCMGTLCVSCKNKLQTQRCPFCQRPFGCMKGNQPDGAMSVSRDDKSLKGHHKSGCLKITYFFPKGKQGTNHPEPGKSFESETRIAYIPASLEGNHVLRLLRVAFCRRLTFTIGDSVTTRRKGVIVWNGIHHKTSLKEGNAFGYPDPGYLRRVTTELSDKGVTEQSMTRDEKKDVDKVMRVLRDKGLYTDT